MKQWRDILLSANVSIAAAMRRIDTTGLRVVYLVNRDGTLAGVVSDSEVRGAVLRGCDIARPAAAVMNPKPIVLTAADAINPYAAARIVRRLLAKMPDSRYILVLDGNGRPCRLAACAEYVRPRATEVSAPGRGVNHVLVVGGAGFLGSVLVPHLLYHGYRVRVLDRLLFGSGPLAPLRGRRGFELRRGDVRDLTTIMAALDGVDAVINLAALVGDPACANLPQAAISTNYLANKALAEACRYHQINRYLFASTCSVYGAAAHGRPLTEAASLNPVSLYARSKIQAEEGILDLVDGNFAPTILRMGTLYGPSPRMRFDLVVNTMVKTAVAHGEIIVHGGGRQWRPLLHVADAAEAYRLCLAAPLARVHGEIFNIGSERQNHRISEIAAMVHRAVPRARLRDEGATADARDYAVSFARVRRRLGFRPRQSLESTTRVLARLVRSGRYGSLEAKKYYNVRMEEDDHGEE